MSYRLPVSMQILVCQLCFLQCWVAGHLAKVSFSFKIHTCTGTFASINLKEADLKTGKFLYCKLRSQFDSSNPSVKTLPLHLSGPTRRNVACLHNLVTVELDRSREFIRREELSQSDWSTGIWMTTYPNLIGGALNPVWHVWL